MKEMVKEQMEYQIKELAKRIRGNATNAKVIQFIEDIFIDEEEDNSNVNS